ncbi:hypothetical protein [Haloarchaeobius sp. DYHT-AS-18]|uniref:hypothetical protein n=1 Tax=Haloarchaeobius sp. DYHT-AS-18 TaxID=3446117 RepID=UPI003EB76FFB
MRLLRAQVALLVVTVALLAAVQSAASRPEAPPGLDHGLSNETFYPLWAGDLDNRTVDENASAFEELSALTDIPFAAPPPAVERWNANDIEDYSRTDHTVSVYPQAATPRSGQFVRDAHVTVFAVQPSTRAHIAPGDEPLYVAADGTVLATLDYRIAVPAATNNSTHRVSWALERTTVSPVRLLVDGQVEDVSLGTKRPRLQYTRLDEYAGTEHDLVVDVTITVALNRTVEPLNSSCSPPGGSPNTTCPGVPANNSTTVTEFVTVDDSVAVTAYELVSSATGVEYPDGDLGLEVSATQPWRGYATSEATVDGRWAFYSARDSPWDTLVVTTANNTTVQNSSALPLQVHAYPAPAWGDRPATGTGPVQLLAADGVERDAPELPSLVELRTPNGTYTVSDRVVARHEAANLTPSLTVYGLVRGVSGQRALSSVQTNPLTESTLRLSVAEATEETVTLEVRLNETVSGAPISTERIGGTVTVDGNPVETGIDGVGTITLPRRNVYAAEYDPGTWWDDDAPHLPAADVLYVEGSPLAVIQLLYNMAIPLGSILLGIFIIDRITGWGVWPPWRGVLR